MQHLVALVRAAAAEVPVAPVPALDIGTVTWAGEFADQPWQCERLVRLP